MAEPDNITAPQNVMSFSSGSASDAMIKAATEASSASPAPAGPADAGKPTSPAGVAAPEPPKAAAIVQPDTSGTPKPPVAATTGEAPEHRIQAAVRNARAEVEQQYAWAKQFNPAEVQEAIGWMRELRRDAKAFYQKLGAEMREAGQLEAPEETLPEADLQTEDGKTKAYSADSMLKIVRMEVAKAVKAVRGEMKPILDERQSAAVTTKARGVALSAIEEGRSWAHFKEHEADIAEVMAAMDPALKRELGPHRVMQRAYNQVFQTVILPKLNADAEKTVREGYEKKVNTSIGSAHPVDNGNGGGGKTPELNSVGALQKHMERLAAAQVAP